MPEKGTFGTRVICAEPSGEIYRNWFHLHPAWPLKVHLFGIDPRGKRVRWVVLLVSGLRQLLDGSVLLLLVPTVALHLLVSISPSRPLPIPHPAKSVLGAQISSLKKQRQILEMSTSWIAGLLDLNLRS